MKKEKNESLKAFIVVAVGCMITILILTGIVDYGTLLLKDHHSSLPKVVRIISAIVITPVALVAVFKEIEKRKEKKRKKAFEDEISSRGLVINITREEVKTEEK